MNTNHQITIRNVDPLLKRRIAKTAKLKSMSINDFALDALRDKVGGTSIKGSTNWEHYSGTIGKHGINQAVLDDFEAVDPAMWKN